MKFIDIRTMTYIGNIVSVDGIEVTINKALSSEFYAVQFHTGNDFCREEPLMKKVPVSKYQWVLDAYVVAKDLLDNPVTVPLTTAQIQEKLINDITFGIDNLVQIEIDLYNKANDMRFGNIDSIAKYLNYPTYEHYNFCKAITDWNVAIFEEARNIQKEVILGNVPMPTDVDAFLDTLVKF